MVVKVWRPCSTCQGTGGWYITAENGREVWMLCKGCGGARGEYVNVYD